MTIIIGDQRTLSKEQEDESSDGGFNAFAQKAQEKTEFKAPQSPLVMEDDGGMGDWLNRTNETSQLGLAHEEGQKRDSEKAAKILRLQAQTGLPQDLIERNTDLIELEAKKTGFDPKAFMKSSPVAATWYAESPNNAALAKEPEDLRNLNYLEKQWRFIKEQFNKNKSINELNDIGNDAMLGKATPEQRKRQATIEAEMAQEEDYGITGFFEQIPGVAAGMTPFLYNTLKGGAKGAAVGAGVGALTYAGASAIAGSVTGPGEVVIVPSAAVVGAAAGAKSGFVVGSALAAGNMEQALSFLELEKIKDENGVPLDRTTALVASSTVGVINGALETLSLSTLAKTIPGLRNLSRDGMKQLLKSTTGKELIREISKRAATSGVTEFSTEFTQELVTSSANELGQMKADGTLGSKTTGEILDKVFSQENIDAAWKSGKAGLQSSLGFSGAGTAMSLKGDIQKVKAAQERVETFRNIGKGISESKVYEKAPQAMQELVKRSVKDTPSEFVYVPVEQWTQYWQKKGADPAEVAKAVTGKEGAYETALEQKTDIRIPTEKYAVNIAPTEHNDFFVEELRTEPTQMNGRESKEYVKKIEAKIQEMQSAIDLRKEEISTGLEQQLLSKGQDPKSAKANADLFGKTIANLEARSQKKFLEDYQLKIGNTENPESNSPVVGELNQKGVTTEERLAKAEEGGFDTSRKMYHGGPAKITDFKTNPKGVNKYLEGVYMTTSKNQASVYADGNKGENSVYEFFPPKDLLQIDSHEEVTAAMQKMGLKEPSGKIPNFKFNPEMRSLHRMKMAVADSLRADGKKATAKAVSTKLRELLQTAGYKGLETQNDTNTVVFDPKHVRATEAKFDDLESTNSLAQDNRGVIKWNERREFFIGLLQRADLSTFPHESAHFFLEVMGDLFDDVGTPQEVKDDYKTILGYLGVEKRSDIKEEHHEKFADAWLRYLSEGNAPTKELTNAFHMFKAWIISLMNTLDLPQINPELKSVFDRMVASEEEIKQTREEQNLNPLFQVPQEVGLSPEEEARYLKDAEYVRQRNVDELSAKATADILRERKEWWRVEKAKVREEVTLEFDQEKPYYTVSVLQTGKLPNGEALPEGMPVVKLSREAIEKKYGKDFAKTLPKGIFSKENGVHFDKAAAIFGFGSGDEMVKSLVGLKNKEAEIEAETQKRMLAQYGDLSQDAAIAPLAMEVVHSDDYTNFSLRELEILASEKFSTFKKLTKKIAGKVPSSDAVKKKAQAFVSKLTVKELTPGLYQNAIARNGKEAVEAFLKGNFQEAFNAKLRQVENIEVYKLINAQIEKVEKDVNYTKSFGKLSVRQKLGKAGKGYLEQIDSIIDRFDFRKSTTLKSIKEKKSLLAWVKERQEAGVSIDLPEKVLNEAYTKSYKEMTVDEFNGTIDSIKNIDHLARFESKLLAAARTDNIEAAEAEILASLTENNTLMKNPADFAPGYGKSIVKNTTKFFAAHTRLEFFFEQLDGFKANGIMWQYFFKPFADAETLENFKMNEVSRKLNKIFNVYSKNERAFWFFDKIYVAEAVTDKTNGNFTKSNIMSIALNWGNSYNRAAIMEGYGWNEDQVNKILDHLDARDWQTVQNIWNLIDEFWPEVRDQEKELTGLSPEKVEANEFENKHGKFKGGYYPLAFDGELDVRQAELDEKANVQELFGGNFVRAMTKHGHTIERTSSAGKPVKLEMSVLSSHITSVIHDLTHRKAIIDVSNLANRKEIKEGIIAAGGIEMYKQIRPWLNSIAGDRRSEANDTIEKFWSRARQGATVVSLGLKMTSAMVQVLGYAITVNEIGAKYAAKGIKDSFGNPLKIKQTWDFIKERSGMMSTRIENYDRDVRDTTKKLNIVGTHTGAISVADAYTKGVRDSFFYFTGFMDLATSVPTWMGAYKKAMDGQLENIEKGDELAAVDYADSVVRKTQSAGAAKDNAAVQRGPEVQKLFTMFYSQMSLQFNQYRKTAMSYRADKNVPRLIGSLAALWFAPAILEDVLRGRTPDEDDDNEKIAMWALKNEVFYPFGSVVLVRDLANAYERYLDTGIVDFSMTPAADAFESMIRTAALATKVAGNVFRDDFEDKEITRSDIKGAVHGVGYAVGLPTRQMWLTGEYFYNWLTGEHEPDNIAQGLWQGLVTGAPRKNK